METKKIKVTVSLDMLQRARDYVERCRNQVIVDEDIEAWIDEYGWIVAKANETTFHVSVPGNQSSANPYPEMEKDGYGSII